jgi:hypothetical protein
VAAVKAGWSLAAPLAVALFAVAQATPVGDNDLLWLLKTGEHMAVTRTFPTTDPFTWTAQGLPWINHTWGFELILYGTYALAGLSGLVLIPVLAALATFGVMYGTLRRGGAPRPWALILVALAALITKGFWAPRPQVVTYLALAILWAILQDYREGRRDRLGWLPLLMVLWVNLHGGFFLGLAVVWLVLLGEAVDRLFDPRGDAATAAPLGRLAGVAIACALAALVNPFHVAALTFPLRVAADVTAKDFIIEWFSPAFQHPELRLLEGLLLFLLAALPAARRVSRLADVMVLVAFIHITLDATRNIPPFVIVLAPVAGSLGMEAWARLGEARRALPRARAVALAVLALAIGLAFFRDVGPRLPGMAAPRFGVAGGFPAGAADFLRLNAVPGAMFNDYGWGGYLTWRLYPGYRVFIDGRIAIFPPDVREDFLTVNNAEPGWQEVLERRGIGLAVVRAGTALSTVLREAGWTVLYQDPQAVVFQRRAEPRA